MAAAYLSGSCSVVEGSGFDSTLRTRNSELGTRNYLARHLLCGLVRGYQLLISPYLPRSCRFYPSCSEYMIQAITEYGALRGLVKGGWRLLRCNPLGAGGYDPVVPNAECGMSRMGIRSHSTICQSADGNGTGD